MIRSATSKAEVVQLQSRVKVTSENGVTVRYNGVRIDMDPRRPSGADFTFISHAHIDHIGYSTHDGSTITSEETAVLAERRGFKLRMFRDPHLISGS